MAASTIRTIAATPTLTLQLKGMCRSRILSLRTTEGGVAISLISNCYKMASVVSLPRNYVTTKSPEGEGNESIFGWNLLGLDWTQNLDDQRMSL